MLERDVYLKLEKTKMKKLLQKFEKVLEALPLLKNYPRLYRLCKFVFNALVIYLIFKAPLIVLFTEFLGLHYVWSGFIVGSILTLINFLPSEFWVWRKKE